MMMHATQPWERKTRYSGVRGKGGLALVKTMGKPGNNPFVIRDVERNSDKRHAQAEVTNNKGSLLF